MGYRRARTSASFSTGASNRVAVRSDVPDARQIEHGLETQPRFRRLARRRGRAPRPSARHLAFLRARNQGGEYAQTLFAVELQCKKLCSHDLLQECDWDVAVILRELAQRESDVLVEPGIRFQNVEQGAPPLLPVAPAGDLRAIGGRRRPDRGLLFRSLGQRPAGRRYARRLAQQRVNDRGKWRRRFVPPFGRADRGSRSMRSSLPDVLLENQERIGGRRRMTVRSDLYSSRAAAASTGSGRLAAPGDLKAGAGFRGLGLGADDRHLLYYPRVACRRVVVALAMRDRTRTLVGGPRDQ